MTAPPSPTTSGLFRIFRRGWEDSCVKHVHFSRRTLVAGITLAALVASISGPAQARQAGSTAHAGAGVLIFPEVISNLWVKNLDPAKMTDANSIYITNMVFSGLV